MKLGLSHAPLASAAIDALEDWFLGLPLETMQPVYTNVLPLLDWYLKTSSTDSKMEKFLLSALRFFFFLIPAKLNTPFTLDQDENKWEVMSSLSSRSDRGYSKVMTRLLKKSSQLSVVIMHTF